MRGKKILAYVLMCLMVFECAVSALGTTIVYAADAEEKRADVEKHETVYVFTDAAGNVKKTTVSNWLKNHGGLSVIDDVSILDDIENVKGDETFTQNGDEIRWMADGDDIYYQGTTTKKAPVEIQFSYFLNGKEVSADALAGASGDVTIKIDYVNLKQTGDIYVPFIVLTGILMPTANVSNVQVDHGTVISEGTNTVVVGYGFPGMQSNIDNAKADVDPDDLATFEEELEERLGSVEIPESVEITLKAEEFKETMVISMAFSDVLSEGDSPLDFDELLEKAGDVVTELKDAGEKLQDGAKQLSDGLGTANSSMPALTGGASQLADGVSQYADGVSQINAGAKSLADGAKQVNAGTQQVVDGVKALAEGAETLNENSEALRSGASAVAEGASTLADGTKQLAEGAVELNDKVQQSIGPIKDKIAEIQTKYAWVISMVEKIAENVDRLPDASEIEEQLDKVTILDEKIKGDMEDVIAALKRIREALERLRSTAQDAQSAAEALYAEAVSLESAAEADAESLDAKIDSLESQASSVAGAARGVADEAAALAGSIGSKAEGGSSGAGYGALESLLGEIAQQQEIGEIDAETLNALAQSLYSNAKADGEAQGAADVASSISGNVSSLAESASAVSESAQSLSGGISSIRGFFGDILERIRRVVSNAAEVRSRIAAIINQAAIDGIDVLIRICEAIRDNNLSEINAAIKEHLEHYEEAKEALRGFSNIGEKISNISVSLTSLTEGTAALAEGAVKVQDGAEALAEGAESLNEGVEAYTDGVAQLAEGAETLNNGVGALGDGTQALAEGAETLAEGAETLNSNSEALTGGAQSLASGAQALAGGIAQLLAGSVELSDGMTEFNEEGIQKLVTLYENDVKPLLLSFQEMAKAAEKYTTFSGTADDMPCTVRFIFKADEIG